jgi:phosphoglucosamine mutase
LLKNIKNIDKKILQKNNVQDFINNKQNLLGNDGRILIRPSGTEELVRVMVESSDLEQVREISSEITKFLTKEGDTKNNG